MTSIDLPDNPVDLARLQDAVAEKLARVSLDGLSNRELLDVVQDVERSHRRNVGVDARLFVEVSERGAHRDVGSPYPQHYLQHHLRLSAGRTAAGVMPPPG